MKKGNEKGSVLQFAPFQSAVDEEFWHRLSSLKLNLFGIDDSPISITVEIARKVFVWVSMHLVYILNYQILSLRAESLPPEPCVQSSITRSRGDRNKCSVPGILYNTNTLEGFQALDKQSLLKAEARKIWEDIHSGKAEEDSTILSKFLLISFADLKKWTFHYWFAFPSLSLDPPATLVDLRPASQCLSLEEVESVSAACNEWCSSSATAVSIWLLRPMSSSSNPGWPLCNFLAFICSRWNLEKVHLLCYHENRDFADLGLSLVAEALMSVSQGWKDSLHIPNAVGWELNRGKKLLRCISLAKSMDPTRYEAEGVVMAISMPGHPVPSHEENIVLEDCKHLHNLIDCHDAVFLLTDTRESRWLPTLLCANANKITVTAALGFDSSLVMCHGAGPLRSTYDFKADVVNTLSSEIRNFSETQRIDWSTANRSLDQQCTVTWPGFAPIASALAVELLVGILHHPHGLYAKAEFANSTHNESTEQPLGILPHQIRGSLSQFSQMTLIGHSSKTCSACCCTVVSEYWERGMDFVLQAINHPTYLEDLTGLTELMKSASSFELDWDDEMDDNDNNDDDCVEI
ncbi:hypothetical protein ACSBR1_014775 [Camellia fascicularis]